MVERKDKKYSIAEVFKFVEENADSRDTRKRADFDGDMIKPYSLRYKTFMKTGTTCLACGLEATHFVKERHQSKKPKNYNPDAPYHLNLYGVNDEGEEVLFTKDHVIPWAKGGSNGITNMVTMCTHCNGEKSTMNPKKWQELHPEAQQLPKGKKRIKK